jgi:hypothetical protein
MMLYQSIDLTEMAREGKLDPTIGRDEGACVLALRSLRLGLIACAPIVEIRRTIQSQWINKHHSISF